MQRKEILKKSALTRKALAYYEKQGLLSPRKSESGYRQYTEEDLSRLREIALLRRLGVGLIKIGELLESPDKRALMDRILYERGLEAQKDALRLKGLRMLREDYDPEKAADYVASTLEPSFTIRERLMDAFPGPYGLYVAVHFGSFLTEPLLTDAQREAYEDVLLFLDDMGDLVIAPEIESYLEESLASMTTESMEAVSDGMRKIAEDPETYLEENKDILKEYLAYRQSEEFLTSELFTLNRRFRELLAAQGYYDRLVEKMKILSPAYLEYTVKLEEANRMFLMAYPEAEKLYDPE